MKRSTCTDIDRLPWAYLKLTINSTVMFLIHTSSWLTEDHVVHFFEFILVEDSLAVWLVVIISDGHRLLVFLDVAGYVIFDLMRPAHAKLHTVQ